MMEKNNAIQITIANSKSQTAPNTLNFVSSTTIHTQNTLKMAGWQFMISNHDMLRFEKRENLMGKMFNDCRY